MSKNLFVHPDGDLPERAVEALRGLDDTWHGALIAHDLNQRDEVWCVNGMGKPTATTPSRTPRGTAA